MTIHQLGAMSSPFCAIHTWCKTAELFGPGYDRAVPKVIGTSQLVGKCLASFPFDVEVETLARDISALQAQGVFRLRKWTSCSPKLLVTFVDPEAGATLVRLPPAGETPQREPGLSCDRIMFHFEPVARPNTGRGFLPNVSSLFDPPGLVFPLRLPVNQPLQKLWPRLGSTLKQAGSCRPGWWHHVLSD